MNLIDRDVLIKHADEMAARREDPLVRAVQAEAAEAFAQLYAIYSPRLYRTIQMKHEWSIKELGHALNISEAAAKSRLYRARQQLSRSNVDRNRFCKPPLAITLSERRQRHSAISVSQSIYREPNSRLENATAVSP